MTMKQAFSKIFLVFIHVKKKIPKQKVVAFEAFFMRQDITEFY